MPTQKLVNRNVRKITKVGGKSLAVTLPKELVAGFGLERETESDSQKNPRWVVG